MPIKYKEFIWPSPALAGFGLVFSAVIGLATGYAVSTASGIAVATFGLAITSFLIIKSIVKVTVTDSVKVGHYLLPLKLIDSAAIIDHNQFRKVYSPNDLAFGARTGINYIQIEISEGRDPYARWFIGTKKPNKFLASLN